MAKRGRPPKPRTGVEDFRREIKRLDAEIEAGHRAVQKMENQAHLARKVLEMHLTSYALMHHEGALRAAADGDTRPAEWALTHIKSGKETTVEPAAKTPTDSGIKVFVGIKMGNLPAGSGEVYDGEVFAEEEGPDALPDRNKG